MGTFGGGCLWGGIGGGSASVGVPLSSLIMPSYRIAGIQKLAMTVPSPDMFAEAVPELNRLVGTLNNSRMNIFTIAINAFTLNPSQKIFTIGPGADFDAPRPQEITQGVIILNNSNPVVRMPPMYQMNDEEWSWVALQDIPNSVPLAFYYDGSYDPATGYGQIYLWPQAITSYQLELYTWQALPTFQTENDIVVLPPGGEDVLVYQLAERLAALNPLIQKMSPDAHRIARRALAEWQSHNAPEPKVMSSDAAVINQTRDGSSLPGGHWDYRIGGMR